MIPLYVSEGVAYVWNSNDWYTLRCDHRICGALIGCLPSFPRQNDFLGLPMSLMSAEAALLVEKNICELYELPIVPPSTDETNEIAMKNEIIAEEQRENFKKRRVEQMSQKIDMILAGKRKKLLSKGITEVSLDKDVLLQEEINKLPELVPAHLLVHLPTEKYLNSVKKKLSIESLKPSVTDKEGSLHYEVFKDLWSKGHHITNGSKFSSDFLVYPGDPVKFHATYMLRCVANLDSPFRPTSLVAFGRLAVAVNKIAVLASRSSCGKMEYQSLQWHDSIN